MSTLPNCWEILRCERQKGGTKVAELGECPTSVQGMGHSCWALAGTLCGGVVQGTHAQKEHNCMQCEVYKTYNRQLGSRGSEVAQCCPQEEAAYEQLLRSRMATR